MKLHHNITTSIAALLIITALNPLTAYAIPVGVIANAVQIPFDVINSIESTITAIAEVFMKIKVNILDPLAWVAAKLEIASGANIIINQIKSGRAEGGNKPLFVTNWETFTNPARDKASKLFLDELSANQKVNPAFKDTMLFSLSHSNDPSFFDQYKSTFQQDVGNSPQEFNQNFSNGGWTAWNHILQSPGDNPYSFYLGASQEKQRKEQAAIDARTKEALASGGNLGTQKCDPVSPDPDNTEGRTATGEVCTITRPGSSIGADLSKVLGAPIDTLQNVHTVGELVSAALSILVNNLRSSGIESHNTDQTTTSIVTENKDRALETAKATAKSIDKALTDLEKIWTVKARSLENIGETPPGLIWQLITIRDNAACQEEKHIDQYSTVESDLEEAIRHKEKLEKEVGIPPILGGPVYGVLEPGGDLAQKLSQQQQDLQTLIETIQNTANNPGSGDATEARSKMEEAVAAVQETLLQVGDVDIAYGEQRSILSEASSARASFKICKKP